MPQLLFRGVPTEQLLSVSEKLAVRLAAICECGTDNFTMDCVQTVSIFGGQKDGRSYPFVEVGWFERGTEVRNRFAEAVTQSLQEIGIAESEVAFRTYREDSYYINGRPCV
ncbi:DUF1904 family protein [Paenibacillus sp. NEAU-GSW1]|uniref:DUF1904 family protein n=1 Tax=Paenibacillus sp. NEAU-GSW1 TaxID=2682486 RepID=UPI0012E26803|nr:DUF1904 family protein [Paenibacillus sp. NEAU-GSW1]MUT67536.1 DUF1904 family protein [Paenibacillus sp. NEAU-GSW1]